MPLPLEYGHTTRADRGGLLFRWLRALAVVGCSLLLIATLALVARSYFVDYAVSDPETGEMVRTATASSPPGPYLPLPILSEAAEYWIPLSGRLERCEYTGWDGRWYRMNRGLPIRVPAMIFAIFPG